MSLNSSYVSPLSPPLIDQLRGDLEKISSTENSSQNLDRYALILQSAYINQFTGLETTISNISEDFSLDVFVSANKIGQFLGDKELSQVCILQYLNLILDSIGPYLIFQPLIYDLNLRHDCLLNLVSDSSNGVLPSDGGNFSVTGGLPQYGGVSTANLPDKDSLAIQYLDQRIYSLGERLNFFPVQELQRYASILQSAYINQFTGLETTISNISGDSSLDVFVSANQIGQLLGDKQLSQSYIYQFLSRHQFLSNSSSSNLHFVFKPVLDHLSSRDNHFQYLGSVSSIGRLPQYGGVSTANGQFPLVFAVHPEPVVPAIRSASTSAGAYPDSGALKLVRNSHKKVKVHKRGSNRNFNSQSDGVVLSSEILEPLFEMPIKKAAKKLGISLTALKNSCRKLGIEKWPYRQTYIGPKPRSQRRGSASSTSSINNRAASSSSGDSLPVTSALSSSLEEATGALLSSSEEAASSSSRTSFSTPEVTEVEQSRDNSNVLEVGSDVDLMDTLGEQDSGDELPFIPIVSSTKENRGVYSLSPGIHKIGPFR